MKKKVVFITAIGYPQHIPYAEFCFNTWEWWCKKNDIRLFVMREPPHTPYIIKPTWVRYKLFDVLERQGIEFDQVAMVDADTMVHWNCPDFFDLAGEEFCVVRDIGFPHWIIASIQGYSHLFPGVSLEPENYFNAGFILLNKRHKKFFMDMLDFHEANREHLGELEDLLLKRGTDQTPLNYLTEKAGIGKKYLPGTYNMINFIPESFNKYYDKNINDDTQSIIHIAEEHLEYFAGIAYIWHFAGFSRKYLYKVMGSIWKSLKAHYA